MKTTKLLLCLAVLATVFSACKKDNTTPSNGHTNCTNTFPYVADGHSLRYAITFTFSDDTVFTQTFSNTSTSGVYQVTNVSDQGNLNATQYVQPCSGKLYDAATVADVQTTGNYYRVSTGGTGTAWTETVGQSVYEYNVVGTNVPVTVAAGTFSCYKVTYHQRNTVNTDTIYYSPGAGEVKYDGFALSYELESKNF